MTRDSVKQDPFRGRISLPAYAPISAAVMETVRSAVFDGPVDPAITIVNTRALRRERKAAARMMGIDIPLAIGQKAD